ncbi:hypothetical protein ACHAXA_010456 [Cyclostephanos tholiformis]|uniref:Uncharacterized protein n=1 Tax=Cyclostephanos tholiformis TaxID=382380 RepID=A0ABD3SFV5_9STRA
MRVHIGILFHGAALAASFQRDAIFVDAFNAFGQFVPPFQKSAVAPPPPPPPPSRVKTISWLDVLTYDEPPKFDVLSKTMEYANCKNFDTIMTYYADDYVFRGPVVGPITAEDVRKTSEGFQIQSAYPNLQTRPFGFTVDPDNPYRCYYFERWEGTNTESVKIGPSELPPTNKNIKLPTHVMSVHWNPEGKIRYVCLSNPLDRFEGNTRGAGAIFGLLSGAGVDIGNASVGDLKLRLQQRLIDAIGGFGSLWSKDDDIPSWWKSRAKGADPTDI